MPTRSLQGRIHGASQLEYGYTSLKSNEIKKGKRRSPSLLNNQTIEQLNSLLCSKSVFGFGNNRCKSGFVMYGNVCQYSTIQRNVGFLQTGN